MEREQNIPAVEIAAALAGILQGSMPFLLTPRPGTPSEDAPADWAHDRSTREKPGAAGDAAPLREHRSPRRSTGGARFETFRIEVGRAHGARPGNLIGAIANEADLNGRAIGYIDIREDHSFVDLPVGMPEDIFDNLRAVRVRGTEWRISRRDSQPARSARPPHAASQGHWAARRPIAEWSRQALAPIAAGQATAQPTPSHRQLRPYG